MHWESVLRIHFPNALKEGKNKKTSSSSRFEGTELLEPGKQRVTVVSVSSTFYCRGSDVFPGSRRGIGTERNLITTAGIKHIQ